MRVVCVAVGILTMLGVESLGRAEPESFASVAFLAAGDDARELEASLSERLARLGLRIRVARVNTPDDRGPGDGNERARIWIDMQSAPEVVIRVATVRGSTLETPSERRIPRSESHAVLVEQISEVAYDTLDSLLASEPEQSPGAASPAASGAPETRRFPVDGAGPAPRSAMDSSDGKVRPVPSASSRASTVPGPAPGSGPSAASLTRGLADTALRMHAFASGRGLSSEAPVVPGGGAAAEVSMGGLPGHPSVWLSAALNAPFDAHVAAFTLETSVSCLRLVPSVEIFERRWIRLDAGVGGGVDLLRTIPRTLRASPYPFDHSRTAADGLVTGQVLVRTPVPSGAALTLAADVDYDPTPHHYRAPASPGYPSHVFQLWPVRPTAMIGLCVPLAGQHSCVTGP